VHCAGVLRFRVRFPLGHQIKSLTSDFSRAPLALARHAPGHGRGGSRPARTRSSPPMRGPGATTSQRSVAHELFFASAAWPGSSCSQILAASQPDASAGRVAVTSGAAPERRLPPGVGLGRQLQQMHVADIEPLQSDAAVAIAGTSPRAWSIASAPAALRPAHHGAANRASRARCRKVASGAQLGPGGRMLVVEGQEVELTCRPRTRAPPAR
jgi:hypothetical protein